MKKTSIALIAGLALAITPIALAGPDKPAAASPAPTKSIVTSSNQSVDRAIADANASIAKIIAIEGASRTFANTIAALDETFAKFENDTQMVIFMSNVHPDADIRDASTKAEEKFLNFIVDVWKREDLYKAVKAFADTKPTLQGDEARLLSFVLRDYKRSGLSLTADKRAELANTIAT